MAPALDDLDGKKSLRDAEPRHPGDGAAIGPLVGGVAHDLNNLLTVIMAAASALRERLPADHPGQEDVREIAGAAERAAALTRHLLACSRTGAAAEPTPPRAGEAPRGTGNVLLVEDDPHQRGVLRRALASHGYGVRAVGNATDARGLEGAAPDLILTDVVLPDGNGIDLARELAARWPASAFLFISGYTGEHLEAVGSIPADAHLLPKPFTSDTLLVRVREALAARSAAA